MSATITCTAQDVVDAIRLALAGAANNDTVVAVIESLVADAPASDGSSTVGVRLLVDHIQARGGSFEVPSHG